MILKERPKLDVQKVNPKETFRVLAQKRDATESLSPLGEPLRPLDYSGDEVNRAAEVFTLLISVRDRCRLQGSIDW